ncbi:SDR family NAD(P)-dependent oxidoreductase [Pedobacter sp. SYSU D00535]|uniref:SDR family NAD(P)-dependent oxidoreductase n=1 Tax=Pedobacter sp. SYSU D00535 TaxID=2810308 RepID=UPI001A96288E|nr:glucose 1-dehydrogenase [Pedobacter sp. SYSU D00535]
MKRFQGQTVVITGGNSGIGFATAKAFKEQGAQVIITGRSAEKVEEAASKLGVNGVVADVADLSQLDSLVEQVQGAYGQVDVLFVNAGIFVLEPVGAISEQNFDDLMDINFKGAVFTTEKFLPVLKDGAAIIALSSIAAYTGSPNLAIYSASKAALNSYVRTAAIELSKRNIRINAVNPGPTSTPIFQKLGFPEEQTALIKDHAKSQIPLGKLGEPTDIAELVTFLASSSASFITGGEFNIDGGMLIKT